MKASRSALALLVLALGPGAAAASGPTPPDPARVVGPEACGDCHVMELNVLQESRHGRGFKDLPASPQAEAIARTLGVKRIKREARCASCHFTTATVEGEARAVAGVSCESCHGAARDWLGPHADFGPDGATAPSEPAAHRAERHARARAAGMTRKADLVELASRCYACHAVPDAELVDRTAHPAPGPLELVAWTQGAIRHNYFFSDDHGNREASLAHRRLLLVVGRGLDLEWSLRAVGEAKAKGRYLDAAVAAFAAARREMAAVAARAEVAELRAIAREVEGLEPGLETREAATRAAARVHEWLEKLAAREDGNGLEALDPLLPPAGAYRGKPLP